jgi:hypothetical protein
MRETDPLQDQAASVFVGARRVLFCDAALESPVVLAAATPGWQRQALG